MRRWISRNWFLSTNNRSIIHSLLVGNIQLHKKSIDNFLIYWYCDEQINECRDFIKLICRDLENLYFFFWDVIISKNGKRVHYGKWVWGNWKVVNAWLAARACWQELGVAWMTHGITCNLVTAGAPVTLNRSLITVPARIGSLAALSRATPCKLISTVLSLAAGALRRIRPLLYIGIAITRRTVDIPKSLSEKRHAILGCDTLTYCCKFGNISENNNSI